MKQWTNRPEGSTWGDWGEDDQLGRLNLIDQAAVLRGVAEVSLGETLSLSLPLDVQAGKLLLERRVPPTLQPTSDVAEVYGQHMSEGDSRWVDVVNDDQVTIALQYSTQWDSFSHVGAEFDVDGDGVEHAVFYNGYRAGVDIIGPEDDASRDGRGFRSYAHRLGIENMARMGFQTRAVLIDLERHFGRDNTKVTFDMLQSVIKADGIEIQPGDAVVFHTGWAEELLNTDPNSTDPMRLYTICSGLDGSDPRVLDWVTESGVAALIADNQAVELFDLAGNAELTDRHPFLPLHHHCLFKLGVPLGEMWYLTPLAKRLRELGRNSFLLTAPPLDLPGAVGSPLNPIATL